MDLGLRCSDERADARFLHGLEHGNDAVESPVLELADRAVAFLEIGISLAGLFRRKAIDVFKGRQQRRPDDSMLIQTAFCRFAHLLQGIGNGLDDTLFGIGQGPVEIE